MIHYFDKTKKIIGDVMPFYDKGIFHLFYLLNGSGHDEKNIEHAISKDGVYYKQVESAIVSKNNEEIGGGNIFTGSFVHKGNNYHAMVTFYDVNQPLGREFIAHYISNDCFNFHLKQIIEPNQFYYQGQNRDFRDPNIVKIKTNEYAIFFLGNKKDNPPKNNFDMDAFKTGVMKTNDFNQFNICPPIEGVNDECVDYVYINKTHYLLGCHHYAIGQSFYGPYKIIDKPIEYNVRAGKSLKIKNHYYYLSGFNQGPPTLLKQLYQIKNSDKLAIKFSNQILRQFKTRVKSVNKNQPYLIKFYAKVGDILQISKQIKITFSKDIVIDDTKKMSVVSNDKQHILCRVIKEGRFAEIEFNKENVYSTVIDEDIIEICQKFNKNVIIYQ